MCFLIFKEVSMKHYLFQGELKRYCVKCRSVFYKLDDMLVEFQNKLFFSTDGWEIFKY